MTKDYYIKNMEGFSIDGRAFFGRGFGIFVDDYGFLLIDGKPFMLARKKDMAAFIESHRGWLHNCKYKRNPGVTFAYPLGIDWKSPFVA